MACYEIEDGRSQRLVVHPEIVPIALKKVARTYEGDALVSLSKWVVLRHPREQRDR